mmetsp:Transcript_13598/g.20700  ORF Transcript_13598/g.20700 Transcript_13598/m.20700 type:complete len:328 (+) Transcript_13598:194-1177(+)|eukprot:CAMPEP_0178938204 /NCGR_PEP_ID=MMETSP0786-20121207/26201_1 /TAXON_ID=186022 /ORGANISM="Thalassionema frauenfeldii, Strain CCMP 1798" /LENGTH=327 /DNA_ID=CAMNT_0020616897 /DNA_START=117 /DNA_END=1100 /DNA_ORIENTATION=-
MKNNCFPFLLLLASCIQIVDAKVKSVSSAEDNEFTEQRARVSGMIFVSLLTVGAILLVNTRKNDEDENRHPNAINILAEVAQRQFKGAITSEEIVDKVRSTIAPLGYTPENTLFAQSVCPDEINHEEGDVTDMFTKYLGEVFHMGGLAGVPFTGKTGFGAFSHHVPDDGHCFVLMAPHIGVDDAAHLGKYSRIGQGGGPGAACGAAIGAFKCACSGKPLPSLQNNYSDYQMTYLIHEVNKVKDEIKACGDDNSQQAELVRQCHRIGKEMLEEMINVNYGGKDSTLVVLTGIQINMPTPFDDYFQPLSFFILDKQGKRTDLFNKAFGS